MTLLNQLPQRRDTARQAAAADSDDSTRAAVDKVLAARAAEIPEHLWGLFGD